MVPCAWCLVARLGPAASAAFLFFSFVDGCCVRVVQLVWYWDGIYSASLRHRRSTCCRKIMPLGKSAGVL